MKRILRVVMMTMSMGLLLVTGCSDPKPASHFVVRSADGGEFAEADTEKLRTVLDAFAAARKMPRVKPGEAGIIRYYQANEDYPIAFFAKRGPTYMKVFASPVSPGVVHLDAYTQFRQELANALTQSFPGRVTLSSN